MTSLCAGVERVFRCVYDVLGGLVAGAFSLYAVIVAVRRGVLRNGHLLHHRRRRGGGGGGRRCRRSPPPPPDDDGGGSGRAVTVRPTTATTPAAVSPPSSAVATVGRAFSETKV